MRVRLAVVDIGNGETDYEIQTESGYSLDKKELEEVVRRVNMHEWLIMELEEHKKKNPVFYDGGHNEDIYKWQCIAEDLEEENERLNKLIKKMDSCLCENGKEIIDKENQRADMQFKIDQLSARNRELARALEYIVNDVTEETIAGGIRVLKKIKGVEW